MTPGGGQGPAGPEEAPGPAAAVRPLGRVHPVACAVAAAHLRLVFGLAAAAGEPLPPPDYARLPARGQHDAAEILARLAGLEGRPALLVALTEADLCLPALTHVYGEAAVGGGVAVVSLHRLRAGAGGAPAAREVWYRRLAALSCHESGHALGLEHCRRPGCLMRFPASLEAVDGLEMGLCKPCRGRMLRLRQGLAAGAQGA